LTLTPQGFGVRVRVTNETAHKLPSGYPEGRRIWLHVRAFNAAGQQIFESGAYDAATGDLTHDSQAKIYHVEPGLSPALAQALGFPAGPSFHFVLNDSVYADNRIPPRGFNNANFAAIQSPPVGHAYADGQYWDDTEYILPVLADSVVVSLNYQTLSKEYVTFLRDANTTNAMGQNLYNSWAANGKSAPVVMAQAGVGVHVVTSDARGAPAIEASLAGTWPNPFRDGMRITYAVAERGPVQLAVFDVRGRRVRSLVATTQDPGHYEFEWDARDGQGQRLAAGVYFVQYQTGGRTFTKRVMRLQ
jgi:flagellar hook capping protein FlgD